MLCQCCFFYSWIIHDSAFELQFFFHKGTVDKSWMTPVAKKEQAVCPAVR